MTIKQCSGNPTVTADGAVSNANNVVTCTLTGAGGSATKTVTASGHGWSVDFGAKAPGTYQLTASAPMEQMASCPVQVN